MNKSSKLKQLVENNKLSYKTFFNKAFESVYIMDDRGYFIAFNQRFVSMTGYNEQELKEGNIQKIIHAEDVEKANQYFQQTIQTEPIRGELRFVTKRGEIRTVSIDAVPIIIEGEKLGFFVIGKDISGWIEKIKSKDKKFKSLIKNSLDIISIINANGEIVYFSDSLETVLGYTIEEMSGSIYQFMHAADINRVKAELEEVFHKGLGETLKTEVRIKHKNGQWLDIQAIATNLLEDPAINGIVVNYRDISDLKKAQKDLQYIAYHDLLTGLPNRRLFERKLTEQLSFAKQTNSKFAVLLVDLDNFKSINDTLGHDSGDLLLKKVANILEETIADKGIVARWGGDEFFVLLCDVRGRQEIYHYANAIKHNLSSTFTINHYEFLISGSIGVSIFPDSGEDEVTLLKTADLAMYKTKNNGKNDFYIFTEEMMDKAANTFALQRDLHQALKNNEFELYYQPKINTNSRKICGAEALIRWNHPTRGLIPPNDFIYLAEESGLIVPIGDWVYQEACRQVKRWKESGRELIKISVNFSTLQFLQKDLVSRVEKFLKENEIDGKWIEIEITESILVQNDEDLIQKMKGLKSLGVNIVLDDFGKGYSSIDYLRKFKFNSIKLDRSFIKDIHKDDQSKAIAGFMIALGKNLNTTIVAEGVEVEEQVETLEKLHCDEYQGYYFSKPVPVDKLEEFF